jgi:hypothetical protein
MSIIKRFTVFLFVGLLAFLMGCGGEGPFGNTPPQGRPDWMKKSDSTPNQPPPPQKQ